MSDESPADGALPGPAGPEEQLERCLFHFVRRAPFLPSAGDLAVASSPVEPWPHQLRVVRETAQAFPRSFLLADEVGLGKTVEAALLLRRLWISGRVRRALILVPKSVLRQWQEELREKAALDVPIFAAGRFHHLVDPSIEAGSQGEAAAENPWDRYPLVLASTQTARTVKGRRRLLDAAPWDLLIVDEAHHARRRGSPESGAEPNRLLSLLAGTGDRPGLVSKARCVYLLTATPMQLHPLEVWDLLRLLGAGGLWGTRGDVFVRFFEQLGLPPAARDWPFLWRLVGDPRQRDESLKDVLGEGPWTEDERPAALESLDDAAQVRLDRALKAGAPSQTMIWRHTRSLLRRYHRAGLTAQPVAERRPENVWIELSAEERRVYDGIDDYLSRFYQRYEAKRSGLGFVMTVYRRRLTSSFRAVQRSLERRLEVARGRRSPPVPEWSEADEDGEEPVVELPGGGGEPYQESLFESMDEASSEPDLGMEGDRLPSASYLSRDEIGYLEAFLADLAALPTDSKLARLRRDLDEVTATRDRVLVFTQYLDTLDYLREELAPVFTLACYSGRGGEVLRGGAWVGLDKESLKERFGDGEIQVLLCTEAAAEGLNFQSCGVLINYDMPWNPMRVEQRIGRVDRIGQRHAEVWIRNYFYADTVEATIYRRLSRRIDWFQSVLGDLQPILHRVGASLKALALTPTSRRPKSTDETVAQLEAQLEARPAEVVGDGLDEPLPAATLEPSPVPWPALRDLFLESRFRDRFRPDELPGAHVLSLKGRDRRVTFDPALFGRYPYSLQLLTWGNGLFEGLLDEVPEPVWDDEPGGLGWYGSALPSPVDLFLLPREEVSPSSIVGLKELRRIFDLGPRPWSAAVEGAASSTFSKARREVLQGQAQVDAERRAAEREALRAGSADVLLRSALVELARAENPGLFDRRPAFGFGPEAIRAQARHGDPFESLVRRLGDELPEVSAQDPRYLDLRRRSPEALYRYQEGLFDEGRNLLERRLAIEAADREAQRRQKDLSGLLQRRYALWTSRRRREPLPQPPLSVLSAEELAGAGQRPFVDAVPFFETCEVAASYLAELAETGSGLPFAELEGAPESVSWVRPDGRYGAAPGLFVCPMQDSGLEPHVAEGAFLVLRLIGGAPRNGDRVLIRHPALRHVDAGHEVVVRVWAVEKGADRRPVVTLRRGDGSLCARWDEDEASEAVLYAALLEAVAPRIVAS